MKNLALCVSALVAVSLSSVVQGQAPVQATLLIPLTPTSSSLRNAQIVREGDTVHLLGECGGPMRFASSTDGGRTWPMGLRTLTPSVGYYAMAASGPRVYIAWQGLTSARQLWISSDGGLTFPTVRSIPNGFYAPHVHASGLDLNLLQVGDPVGVLALHSADGGATWASSTNLAQGLGGANASDLSLHVFADGGELIAVWERRVPRIHVASCRSTDGGATWSASRMWPTDAPLVAVAAALGRWFAQAGSTLWRSTNHGVTWSPVAGHGFAFPAALAMDGPRLLAVESVAANLPLRVAASLDGGDTWSISSMTLPWWVMVEAAVVGDAMFVVVPGRGVHQSDDGGVSWRTVEDQEVTAWHAQPDGAIAVAFVPGAAAGDFVWVSEGHSRLGTGTTGTGGIVPSLRGAGLAGIGRTFSLELDDALGGSLAAFWIAIGNASVAVVAPTTGAPGQPGAGAASFPVSVPANPAFVGLRLLSRGYVFDAAAAQGYCATESRESWIR